MKRKVLFILHLPPPIHGAATVGAYIKEKYSKSIDFDSHFINLSTSKSLNDIGRGGGHEVIFSVADTVSSVASPTVE